MFKSKPPSQTYSLLSVLLYINPKPITQHKYWSIFPAHSSLSYLSLAIHQLCEQKSPEIQLYSTLTHWADLLSHIKLCGCFMPIMMGSTRVAVGIVSFFPSFGNDSRTYFGLTRSDSPWVTSESNWDWCRTSKTIVKVFPLMWQIIPGLQSECRSSIYLGHHWSKLLSTSQYDFFLGEKHNEYH